MKVLLLQVRFTSGENIHDMQYNIVIIFAVKSFVELTRYLTTLSDTTGQYFLSERISQDPLENYFGRVRAKGGRCENPTAKDCLVSAQSLRVQGSFAMQPIRGNSI